jgi:hypothetical protein
VGNYSCFLSFVLHGGQIPNTQFRMEEYIYDSFAKSVTWCSEIPTNSRKFLQQSLDKLLGADQVVAQV